MIEFSLGFMVGCSIGAVVGFVIGIEVCRWLHKISEDDF